MTEPGSLSRQIFWMFWGKTDHENPEQWHGLAWHCLEVGLTTQMLVRSAISARRCAHLARVFGVDEVLFERWIGFLAATHDYGKLSSLFQSLVDVQKWRIEDAFGGQLEFLNRQRSEPRHGLVSTVLLIPRLQEAFGMDAIVAERHAMITGSHHGILPTWDQIAAASKEVRSVQVFGRLLASSSSTTCASRSNFPNPCRHLC